MSSRLLAQVTSALDDAGIRYAVIGAGALAAHGVARSTFDLDLFTTDRTALDPRTWREVSADSSLAMELRRGDSEDPLAGLVRFSTAGERDIDVVVGRWSWQADAVERALPVEVAGIRLPIVTVEDLVLFKLYAGGSQDHWDIEQLLARDDRETLIDAVNARVASLAPANRTSWARLIGR